MSDTVQRLLTLLELLLAEHQQLVSLTERQKSALIRRDTRALEPLVAKIDRSVTRVQELETERRRLQADLAREYQLEEGQVTVSELARRLEAPLAGRLQKLGAALREAIVRLQQLCAENERIMQQSLRYIEQMFEWIRGSAESTGYGPRTPAGRSPSSVAINVRA
ncbi:flagellar protein FlgN [Alicyclobacillus shizuokensis]|uniref:flagellar protein FlgN n=1 Tax=Alicyclobacillus shizuokensis TaxID=392014 RepID=UPI00082E4E73|nr:flagellar protein FlgN [Alicyclobacillus shizuokensis]